MNWPVNSWVALVQIQFHNFGTRARTCVANFHADLDRLVSGLVRSYFQVAIRKGCITQSEAKGKLRFNILGIKFAGVFFLSGA
jgi:hypothetical protein